MPYEPHTRIQVSGTFGPENTPWEIFSMSLALSQPLSSTSADDLQFLQEEIGSWFGRSTTNIVPMCRVRQVAYADIGPDGKQIGETIRFPRNSQGGGSDVAIAPQVALRLSLSNGLRGRANKGGFYIPGPAHTVNPNDGLIVEQQVESTLGSTVTMLRNINKGVLGNIVVASSVLGNVDVSLVRLGRRMDVIRRRANALPESYEAATIDPQET